METNEDQNTVQRQWTFADFANPISPCEAQNLTYFVSDCLVGTGFINGIQSAMQAYNIAPISVYWTEVENGNDADLVFACRDGGDCGEAVASTPLDLEALYPDIFTPGSLPTNVQTTFASGGTIGGEILLNTNWTNCECSDSDLDLCFFRSLIMHEVAHALGYAHNDVEFPLTSNGLVYNIDGTAFSIDPTSILNSGLFLSQSDSWCSAPCNFNMNDIVALQHHYPELQIQGPRVLCLGETGRYCVQGQSLENSTLEYIWSTDMISLDPNQTITKTRNCIDYSSLVPGQHNLAVNIYENGCSYNLSLDIFVHDLQECENCYCTCEYILENNHNEQSYHESEIFCGSDCKPRGSSIGNFWVEESEKFIHCE